jgi:MSHA pilin protein MshD
VVQKQALAIADSLLEEVLARPYTYCDPDDANVETAQNALVGPLGCATTPEAMGPELAQGESRNANLTPFDNVNDYNGFNMPAPPGIYDLSGAHITGLDGYSASVQVQPAGAFNGIPTGETLLVTVTVTAPGNQGITLSGYRTRHAPNL